MKKFKLFSLTFALLILLILCSGCRTENHEYQFMQPLENIETLQLIRYYEAWEKYPEDKHIGEIPPSPEVIKELKGEEKDAFLAELQQIPSSTLTWGEPELINRGDTRFDGSLGVMLVYQDGQYEISLGTMQICYYGTYYNRAAVNSFDTEPLKALIMKYVN